MTKLKRWLEGFGPLPSERMTTSIEVPPWMWPVALALTDGIPTDDDPEMIGEWPMTEAKARALATTMGCVLPPDHHWYIGTTAA